jgi:hypothetical protein
MIIEDLFIAVQYVFGFSKDELLVESRKGYRPLARQCMYWYLVTVLKYNYTKAAMITNKKSHLTAWHGCKVIQNIIETKNKEVYPLFEKFFNTVEALKRENPTTLTGHFDETNGQITLHHQKGLIAWKKDILTVIFNDKVKKFDMPKSTSIEEFMSTIINLK